MTRPDPAEIASRYLYSTQTGCRHPTTEERENELKKHWCRDPTAIAREAMLAGLRWARQPHITAQRLTAFIRELEQGDD